MGGRNGMNALPQPVHTFSCKFTHGDRVLIDGDSSLVAVIVSVIWLSDRSSYEISWVHNGTVQSAVVASWRVSSALD